MRRRYSKDEIKAMALDFDLKQRAAMQKLQERRPSEPNIPLHPDVAILADVLTDALQQHLAQLWEAVDGKAAKSDDPRYDCA